MLVLTRRVNESVVIGSGITVTVLGIKGGQVRLGIDAPRDVSVHRGEVQARIRDEKPDSTPASSARTLRLPLKATA